MVVFSIGSLATVVWISTPMPSVVAAEISLPVRPGGSMLGYSREQFGPAWSDVDHNGCDTRNDILARDMRQVVHPRGCQVLSGILDDPYTGKTIIWKRGQTTSDDVQIDHVVSLANAWRSGASALTPAERLAFANDPSNLLAVDGPTNQSEGDKDASGWLPRESFRCTFVLDQIQVKKKYRLWITSEEQEVMSGVLRSCPAK
jgi:hypothetical protein